MEAAWMYQSWQELDGYPYWGRMATYGGGGYVASLGRDQASATEALYELIEHQSVNLLPSCLSVLASLTS